MSVHDRRQAASRLYYFHVHPSPVGELFLVADDRGSLVQLRFLNQDRTLDSMIAKAEAQLKTDLTAQAEPFSSILEQLDAYFEGQRRNFDVDLAPVGTDFQRAVWHELRTIPYGVTTSYQNIATGVASRLGRPTSARAVGGANGANPISIIVPCHRVIGADGSLTGFGGGLDVKQQLLVMEGALLV